MVALDDVIRRHAALPNEHGAWYFVLAPLVAGIAVATPRSWPHLALVVAAVAAFLARHAVTLVVKVLAGRRPRSSLSAGLFWTVVWGGLALAAATFLFASGHGRVLWLALPAIPVLGWHLALVSRKAERRQRLLEVLAAGALAIGAPAALWIAAAGPVVEAGWLWVVVWLHVAGGIEHAYLRLEQRAGGSDGSARTRRAARAVSVAQAIALALSALLAAARAVPPLVPLAFVPQALETWWFAWRPAPRARPTSIGLRQLAVGIVGLAILIVTWR